MTDAPAQCSRPGSRMFASLGIANYRNFFAGALLSNIGGWMQRIAQDWLVLTELTDHSARALGFVTALQFVAMPLLAPWTGAVADRFPKRKVLMVTQLLLALNSLVLFFLVSTGVVTLWWVYFLAFTQGLAMAFDGPARQSFVSEMVPDRLLPNAVGLNSTSFNSARLIGPAAAGALIGVAGVAPALLVNALSFVPMLIGLATMRQDELHPAPERRGRGSAIEGLRYLRGRPDILMVMFVVFMLGTFGMNFQINNAVMATTMFGKGAEEFGLLGTLMAIGTLAAALIAARRQKPRLRVLLGALLAFTVFTTVLALAPSYSIYAILLVPVGWTMLTVMTTANSTVQLATAPQMRGRVMAVYMAIFQGGTPLGAPFVGWVTDQWGPRWGILVGSIACALTFIGVLGFMVGHRGVRFRWERTWPPRLHVWTLDEVRAAQAANQVK